MLECDRMFFSDGNDITKINASKECNICRYWYFLDKGFKCQTYLCYGCHDLIQKAMNFDDVVVVSIKGSY